MKNEPLSTLGKRGGSCYGSGAPCYPYSQHSYTNEDGFSGYFGGGDHTVEEKAPGRQGEIEGLLAIVQHLG